MDAFKDWARTLLEGRHYAVLGTQDDDGSIHLTPVWYVLLGDRLCVGANSASRKVRNVIARRSASLLVDVRKPGSECWVSVSGPVEILKGDKAKTIVEAIQQRYLTEEARRDPKIGPAFAAADDVVVRISPQKIRSWSAKDLDAQFFGGALSAAPQKWFRDVD